MVFPYFLFFAMGVCVQCVSGNLTETIKTITTRQKGIFDNSLVRDFKNKFLLLLH